MKKKELFHVHRLLDEVSKFMLDEQDVDLSVEEFFPVYGDVGVRSDNPIAGKSEHQEGLIKLSRSLSVFAEGVDREFFQKVHEKDGLEDEVLLEDLGRYLTELDFNRKKSAQIISKYLKFTEATVYDKFSDHGIRFSDHEIKYTIHDDEERVEALSLLENYADYEFDRKEALNQVSEQTGIDESTLDNWLVDEEIFFTDRVSAVVKPESKQELIETAKNYFNLEKKVDSIEQALGYNIDTLRLYRDDGIDSMPLELLDTLDSLFESEPVFRMDNLDRYIEEDTRYGFKLDDEFQSFLFSHITGEELEGMTGQSDSTLTRYRKNRTKTVNREAYKKAFQAVSYMYDKHPEPDIEKFIHSETCIELSENEITGINSN